jgi:voltage-gated potassium channel
MSRSEPPKTFREFSKRFTLFAILLCVILLFGTFAFTLLQNTTPKESLVQTLETLAFMFEDDVPWTITFLQIFLAIFGVFVCWWILWGLFDMLFTQEFIDFLNYEKTKLYMRATHNHTIVIGGGITGMHLGSALKKKKEKYIIVEHSMEQVRALRKQKLLCVLADATNKLTYNRANVKTAKNAIITLPDDQKAILIAITLKSLNPKIHISARLNNPEYTDLFLEVGISHMINPQIVIAEKLLQ